MARSNEKDTPGGLWITGGLQHSIQSEIIPKGMPVQKGIPIIKGVIQTSSKYGEVVEKGRRPGKGIPIKYLSDWVQKKFGISDPEDVRRVSLIISRRAKLYGIEGVHMFENALNENMEKVVAIFKKLELDISVELEK